jgi:hypothetical protein
VTDPIRDGQSRKAVQGELGQRDESYETVSEEENRNAKAVLKSQANDAPKKLDHLLQYKRDRTMNR